MPANDEALTQFRTASGFGNALDALADNPLPDALVVTPAVSSSTPKGTAALLGLGIVLVVGNTIRLDILNRRGDIEVLKLVGGTDGFARRPFLYAGIW